MLGRWWGWKGIVIYQNEAHTTIDTTIYRNCNPFGRPASPKRRMRDPGKGLVNDIQVAFCFPLQVVYVCSFVYSLGVSFVHSIVRVFVPSFLLFVRLFVRPVVWSFVRSFVRVLVRLIVRLIFRLFVRLFVCSFVRSFAHSSACSFVCPFFFFNFLSLDIDANIIRHSRKEVVNDIEKH